MSSKDDIYKMEGIRTPSPSPMKRSPELSALNEYRAGILILDMLPHTRKDFKYDTHTFDRKMTSFKLDDVARAVLEIEKPKSQSSSAPLKEKQHVMEEVD